MGSFCYKTANIWQIVGYVTVVLKIVVPLIIIILGSIEFGKAAISSDEKEMKISANALLKRALIGIIIFFVPTIISYAFKLIGGFEEVESDYMNCVNCLTKPGDCNTNYKGGIFDS